MPNAISERLETIQKAADISGREIAELLSTTPETISRWRGGRSEPQPKMRDSLLQLGWLVSQLAELYDPKEAHLWLFSPHRMLDGARPFDFIQQGQTERVLQIIAQLRDGAFV